MELYSYFRSSASYRVRIALKYKNMPYEYKAVHLLEGGGQQRKDDFTTLNPMQQVPTLVHEGKAISQSMAIFEYLDQINPDNPLFSSDPMTGAKIRQICELVNSGIQPLVNLYVLQTLKNDFGLDDNQKNKWAVHFHKRGLEALNKLVLKSVGRFAVGHQVSAADMFIVAHVFSVERYGIDVADYPLLERIYKTCMDKTEVKVLIDPPLPFPF